MEEGRIALHLLERKLLERKLNSNSSSHSDSNQTIKPINNERKLLDKVPRETRLRYRKGSPLGLTLEELDDRGLLEGSGSVPSYYTSIRQRERKRLEMRNRSSRLQERDKETMGKMLDNFFHMIRVLTKRGVSLEEYCREQDWDGRGLVDKKEFLSFLPNLGLPLIKRDLLEITNRYTVPSTNKVDFESLLRDGNISSRFDSSDSNCFDNHSNSNDNTSNMELYKNMLMDLQRMLLESLSGLEKTTDDIYKMFSRCDVDGTSTIQQDQFLRTLSRLYIQLSSEEIEYLSELLDTTGTGKIDFDILLSFCFSDPTCRQSFSSHSSAATSRSARSNSVDENMINYHRAQLPFSNGFSLSSTFSSDMMATGRSVERDGVLSDDERGTDRERGFSGLATGASGDSHRSRYTRSLRHNSFDDPNGSITSLLNQHGSNGAVPLLRNQRRGRPLTAAARVSSKEQHSQKGKQPSSAHEEAYSQGGGYRLNTDGTDEIIDDDNSCDDGDDGDELLFTDPALCSSDDLDCATLLSDAPPPLHRGSSANASRRAVAGADSAFSLAGDCSSSPFTHKSQQTGGHVTSYLSTMLHDDREMASQLTGSVGVPAIAGSTFFAVDHALQAVRLSALQQCGGVRGPAARSVFEHFIHLEEQNMPYSRNSSDNYSFSSFGLSKVMTEIRLDRHCLSQRVIEEVMQRLSLDKMNVVSFAEFCVFLFDPDYLHLEHSVQQQTAAQLERLGGTYRRSLLGLVGGGDPQHASTAAATGPTAPRPQDSSLVSHMAFQDLFEQLGLVLTQTDAQRLTLRFDVHGNGLCSVDRFVRCITSGGAWQEAEQSLQSEPQVVQPAELLSMADHLGIDPATEAALLWIAAEAVRTPLPAEWSPSIDSRGRPCFYSSSGSTSYEHPLDNHFRLLRDACREQIAALAVADKYRSSIPAVIEAALSPVGGQGQQARRSARPTSAAASPQAQPNTNTYSGKVRPHSAVTTTRSSVLKQPIKQDSQPLSKGLEKEKETVTVQDIAGSEVPIVTLLENYKSYRKRNGDKNGPQENGPEWQKQILVAATQYSQQVETKSRPKSANALYAMAARDQRKKAEFSTPATVAEIYGVSPTNNYLQRRQQGGDPRQSKQPVSGAVLRSGTGPEILYRSKVPLERPGYELQTTRMPSTRSAQEAAAMLKDMYDDSLIDKLDAIVIPKTRSSSESANPNLPPNARPKSHVKKPKGGIVLL